MVLKPCLTGLNRTFLNKKNFIWNVFSNIALTDSQYLKSDAPNIEGNKVEFTSFNIKTGTGIGYKTLCLVCNLRMSPHNLQKPATAK
jgi:hypothetical protein